MMFFQPLEQFTNLSWVLHTWVISVACFILISINLVLVLLVNSAHFAGVVARWNNLFEIFQSQLDFRAQVAFVLFGSYVAYILASNLLGLIPGGWTITAQLFHNLMLSFMLIVGLTFLGVIKFGSEFVKLFMPSNVPVVIFPFITLLEVLSFGIRIVSLALRLFANMVAGHTLLHVLHGFLALGVAAVCLSTVLLISGFLILVPAYLIVAVITLFEFVVAGIQAYVFGLLFLVYCKDLYPAFSESRGEEH